MGNEINNIDIIEYIISEESKGLRADLAITMANDKFSRSLIQKWIKKGRVLVNGRKIKPKDIVNLNDKITINPEENINSEEIKPEKIKLEIAYEDKDIIVINKHSNIIAHPAAGHNKGTVANGLAHLYPELLNLPRSGLIHRLDKNTTGLLIVARNIKSYTNLVKSMQGREISRYYVAYTHGLIMRNNTINQPIGRHKTDRMKMAVNINGKEAITHYEVQKNYKHFSKLKLKLHTGRTHQIRVHMQFEGYPLIGDQTYGAKINDIDNMVKIFPRQALHAETLQFIHPENKKPVEIKSSLPIDLVNLEELLESHE